MTKISELVLNDPSVKQHDLIIAIMATLCGLASLSTKTFLTFSGGADAIYVAAAGYFAIGGNLILLAPKFIKSPIQKIASVVIPFLGEKSNFAFVLKTLGALGFVLAGILEKDIGLGIGGAGLFLGNIIAMIKGYKVFSVVGYGVAIGSFTGIGLFTENYMLFFAGISAIFETLFLAIYKNHDETRSQVLKEVWEEKKIEIENEEEMKEELEKLRARRRRGKFSNAFMSNVYDRDYDKLTRYFDSEFARYAHTEKQVIEESEEKEVE